MKKEKKDKHFIKKPIYPGGQKAMKEFLAKNKRYPKQAFDNNIEGVVRIRYEIDYKGNVVSTQVMSGIGHGCDEEAERLVKMLKFEVPRTRKAKVAFHKTINIHFKKPVPKKKQIKLSYSFTSSSSASTSQSSTYNYTIVPSKK